MRPVILVLMTLALGGFLRPVHTARAQAPIPSGTIITIAGNGSLGFTGDGGQALSASFNGPVGMAVGPDGTLYVADSGNYRIRAINPLTGIISTVAGNGLPHVDDGPNGDGGQATDAQIGDLMYIDLDRQRNTLYIPSAVSLFRVRRVDLSTGIIENFAGIGIFDNEPGFHDGDGGPATSAYLFVPLGLAVGLSNDVLITDLSYRLRSVDGATGIINRVAGIEAQNGFPVRVTGGDGGLAQLASFRDAWEVAADRAGNIFVMDVQDTPQPSHYLIRRIDAVTGIIDTIAGSGTITSGSGEATEMFLANGGAALTMAVDDAGQTLYLHRGNNEVVEVDLATGQLTPFAGTGAQGFAGDGGPASDALFFDIGGLTAVPGGGLLVADTDNQRIRYIAPNSINLVGDAGQTEFYLPWVSALAGDVNVSNNPNVTTINLSELTSVAGSLDISGNPSAGSLDLGSLQSAGSLDITNNPNAGSLDLGSLQSVAGSITIAGNASAGSLDLSALQSAGSLTITDNGSADIVIGADATVAGSLTLDTTGAGTLDLDGVDVGGDTNLTAEGYTTVDASTAGGETVVTMNNNEATMEVTLPDGAFTSATPVAFSITNIPGGSVETVGGETVTHLETYAFDFAIPTLNTAAELNFEIDLVALDEPDRLALLGLVHDSADLTLSVRGDAPGAELQLFDVCSGPVADACVVVKWLDANRMVLDPQGGIDPAILRLEGLVGHFSTYSFVAVGLAGDYNLDGVVDAADYVFWRKTFGQSGTHLAADGNRNNLVDSGDYGVWRAHFGNIASSGSGAAAYVAVPEPATWMFIALAAAGWCMRRRPAA